MTFLLWMLLATVVLVALAMATLLAKGAAHADRLDEQARQRRAEARERGESR